MYSLIGGAIVKYSSPKSLKMVVLVFEDETSAMVIRYQVVNVYTENKEISITKCSDSKFQSICHIIDG